MKIESVGKIKIIGFLILCVAFLMIAKAYYLQIFRYDYYSEQSNKQLENRTFDMFNRGSIFFEEKSGQKISAANLSEGYILSINPSKIKQKDIDFLYNKLNSIVVLDKDIFFKKAKKVNDPYEELATRLDKKTGKKISSLNLDGVNLISEKWRSYPTGVLAAKTIGFVGYKGNLLVGRYGLEKYYEEVLERSKKPSFTKFFAEIFSETKNKNQKFSGDLIISIEPTVQNFLEKELEATIEKWTSKSAGGIIMDPKTGEIIAMASRPTFNPNQYNKVGDISIFSNPLTEDVFEMGSIMKPLTIAVGLDSKVIDTDFTYNDKGYLKINDRTIYNYDFRGRGNNVPLQQILSQSLNTGAATIALKVGKEKMVNYFKNFGFGEETGIDLPGEIPGLVKNFERGGEIEVATASFGQGIAITPIEMIRALSVLANGGVLPSPHLVKKIEYVSGVDKKIIVTNEEMRRVIKKETADKVTVLLSKVFDEALKGGKYKIDRYSIATKTGTAQIADKETGGYFTDKYFHSFFGYFPAFTPRFIVFLYTNEPNANYASNTLTEPFMEIVKFLLNYYQIPPDR